MKIHNPRSRDLGKCTSSAPCARGYHLALAWFGFYSKGEAADPCRQFGYDGPHLQAELGSQRVVASYTAAYRVIYDFATDTITRE